MIHNSRDIKPNGPQIPKTSAGEGKRSRFSRSFSPSPRSISQNSQGIKRLRRASFSRLPAQDDVEPISLAYPQPTPVKGEVKSKKEYKTLIEIARAIREKEAKDFDDTKTTEFLTSRGYDADAFKKGDIINFTKNVNKKSKKEKNQNPKYLEFQEKYQMLIEGARDAHNQEKQDGSSKCDFTVSKARKFLESRGYHDEVIDDDIHQFFRHVIGKSPQEKMEEPEYQKIYNDREQIIANGRIFKRQKAEENNKPYRKIGRKDVKEMLENDGYNPRILSNKELDELAEEINGGS